MSYLVAYVKFPGATKDYPTDCFRSDIETGDAVLVRRRDGKLRPATVTRVEYLDWDCGATLLCKASEAERTSEGLKPPQGAPVIMGLTTQEALCKLLIGRGWTPLKTTNNVHSLVLTYSNQEETANIWLRRRGVDFQIVQDLPPSKPKALSYSEYTFLQGRTVRHFLAKTNFNLYDGVIRFAESFENIEKDYDRFFKSVGSRDRRTADLPCRDADAGFDAMLYDALGGDGGSVYIGDGLYMGADGAWHE